MGMAVQELQADESPREPALDVFVSRQPIIDGAMRVEAYQVTYAAVRDGELDEEQIARLFGDVLSTVGLEELVGSSVAHLMVSGRMLQSVGAPPLPSDRTVLRIAHDTAVDPSLQRTLRSLVDAGFRLSLSQLSDPAFDDGLLRIFDTVEIDFSTWDELAAAAAAARITGAGRVAMATGLSYYTEFEMAKALGFERFAGPFFCAPRVTSARQVPIGDAGALTALARLRPNAEVEELEQLIDRDLGLSVKLLRYINSAYFGLRREITSIRQAIMMLGSQEISRWALVIALAGSPTAPRELSMMALTRARMCQLLGPEDGGDDNELFTIGLLSLADALLDMPLDTVVAQLPLAGELEEALLWRAGPAGEILDAAIAFERGEFDAPEVRAHADAAATAYRDSVRWAHETLANFA